MTTHRVLLALLLALIAASAAPAQVGPDSGQDVDTLVLIDGATTNRWEAVEGTLTRAIRDGFRVFRFHVPVDWTAGEPDYPIGWPRLQPSLTDDERDWSDWTGWEQIRIVVYAETTRDALPRLPLGIAASTGEQNANWGRECEGLRRDEWGEFVFDLADLPLPDQVRSLSLYISDSEYRHGDTVTFSISQLELLRYRKPTLIGFRPVAKIAFADERVLGLIVHMLGIPPDATAPVEVFLARGDETLAKHVIEVAQGTTRIAFPLPQRLAPATYSLVISAAGRAMSDTVELVPSPWQKGE